MGKLIDEEELQKYIMHDGCEKGCGYIDERDLKYISPAEAIPKVDYEAKLKADVVDMLEEIQLEIKKTYLLDLSDENNVDEYEDFAHNRLVENIISLIQQKINLLKE